MSGFSCQIVMLVSLYTILEALQIIPISQWSIMSSPSDLNTKVKQQIPVSKRFYCSTLPVMVAVMASLGLVTRHLMRAL